MSHLLIALATLVTILIICAYGMHHSLQRTRDRKLKQLILQKYSHSLFKVKELELKPTMITHAQVLWFVIRQYLIGNLNKKFGMWALTDKGRDAYRDYIGINGGYARYTLID